MQKAPQGGQNDPQEGARDASGAAQETPGAPQERPQRRQERPKRRQEHPRRDPGALLGATFGARWRPEASGGSPGGFQEPFWEDLERILKGFSRHFSPPPEASFGPFAVLFFAFCTHSKAQERNEKTRHEAQQGKAEQQSRSAPRHTPKRRACQAKRLARTSSSASVRTNTATANSGRTLSTACAATFQRIVRRCRLHLLGLPGRAFRPRANPGLTRRWAAGPANLSICYSYAVILFQ